MSDPPGSDSRGSFREAPAGSPGQAMAWSNDAPPSWGRAPASGWGSSPSVPPSTGGSAPGSSYGNNQVAPAISVAPDNPDNQAGQVAPALAITSPGGAGANGLVVTSVTTPSNGGTGSGPGTYGSLALAPALIVIPTGFTVSTAAGRSNTNGGSSGRGPHDEVTTDHGGSAANDGANNSTGTGADQATTAGVVNQFGPRRMVATVAPRTRTRGTSLAFGVAAGNTGGRAIFGGNIEPALAGAISPIRLTGAGPLAPVPIPRLTGAGSGGNSQASTVDPAGAGLGAPSSRPSDLLTDFKPFDRGALEDAIDRFLTHFDDLGNAPTGAHGPTDLLTEIMAVAVALTSAKVGLRLFWRPRDDETAQTDTDVCVNLDPFPGPLDL